MVLIILKTDVSDIWYRDCVGMLSRLSLRRLRLDELARIQDWVWCSTVPG